MEPISVSILLAMQAAGMVVDWMGTNKQNEYGRMGAKIEQAGIAANLATNRLQAEDESLSAMKQLRQNLGTQAAIFAARGMKGGTGGAVTSTFESIGNFNSDERTRRMNLLASQASLKAGMTLSKLHQNTSEAQQWNQFKNRVIARIPTSPDAFSQIGKAYGLGNL